MSVGRKVFLWLRKYLMFFIAGFEAVNVALMLVTPAGGPSFAATAGLSTFHNPFPFLRNLVAPLPYMRKHFWPCLVASAKTRTFWFYYLEYVVLLLALPYFVAFIFNLDAPEYTPLTVSLSRIGLLWVFGDFDVVGKFMTHLSRDILYLNSAVVVVVEVLYVLFFCESCHLPMAPCRASSKARAGSGTESPREPETSSANVSLVAGHAKAA
jgi:hypothetical protein